MCSAMVQAVQPQSSPPMPDADRLRVVITGGSAGIGASIVRTFCAAGHDVLFTYLHSLSSAREIASQTRASSVHLDQGSVASVAAFASHVASWAGDRGVDVLVNNAALGSATVARYVAAAREEDPEPRRRKAPPLPKALARAEEDEALMRVNSLGPLWVTDALMPLVERAAALGRKRAVIIFIGSVGGGSAAVFPEYRAADLMGKAAMTYLAKHLAAEHVRSPVDVMCVSPGATETDMFRESTLSGMEDAGKFIDGMPKRRLIQPEDLAETVRWLAVEPAARVFHGAVLDASMGLAVRPGLQTEQSDR